MQKKGCEKPFCFSGFFDNEITPSTREFDVHPNHKFDFY